MSQFEYPGELTLDEVPDDRYRRYPNLIDDPGVKLFEPPKPVRQLRTGATVYPNNPNGWRSASRLPKGYVFTPSGFGVRRGWVTKYGYVSEERPQQYRVNRSWWMIDDSPVLQYGCGRTIGFDPNPPARDATFYTVQDNTPVMVIEIIVDYGGRKIKMLVPGAEEFDKSGKSLGMTPLFSLDNTRPMAPGQVTGYVP